MIKSMETPGIPLAERMRPGTMEDMVGQEHILGPGCPLSKALRNGRIFSVILWGPPGSGKTTLAKLMGGYAQLPSYSFSAVTSGIKELRQLIEAAEKTKANSGQPSLLFVDEIHRFNKAQQDAFLPHVESGLIILVGATTQNPSFEVIPPLLSRARVMVLKPLEKKEIETILLRALSDEDRGLGALKIEITPDALEHLVGFSMGDARVALNNLESARGARQRISPKKVLPYDKDGEEHYNLISAFHKSLRGSDTQASVYWLYRMLMAGEDPLFICRRMIRFASEDVGLADPNALQAALAAFEAWQKVGPPEAELTLAQAAVYLASAPKSNAMYLLEKTVKEEIKSTGAQPVPLHIRNAPTRLMKKLGYSKGYLYPHNYPGAWVEQEYLPKNLKSRAFYRPTDRGFEREIRRRMEALRRRGKESKSDR